MSATKNKAIEKLNEPAKPTAARKKQIKKAVTAVVERQAVEVEPILSEEEIADAIKKYVLPDSSLHGESVAQITTVIPPVEPIEQPTEPTSTLKQKAASLWHKWGWALMAFMVVLLALLIYDWIHVVQINKQLRQTQQVESKVADEKANLGQTEAHLSEMGNKNTDSAMKEASQLAAKAVEYQRAWEVTMKRLIETQKEQNDILQAKIRAASDDTLRWLGGDRSGQK